MSLAPRPTGSAQAAGDAVAAAITDQNTVTQQAATDAAEARRIAQEALDAGPDDATLNERIGELEEGLAEWHDRADDLENEIQSLQLELSQTRQQQAELTQRVTTMTTQEPPRPATETDPPSSTQTPPPEDTVRPLETPPPTTTEPSQLPPTSPAEDARPAPAEKRHRLI